MATSYNSKIVTDGLVLCFDPANMKSYGPTIVEALVVGGGGGGGGDVGAGGGAGGLLYSSAISVAAGTAYSVTVGTGGGSGNPGATGGNSEFRSLTAYGGGGGSYYYDCVGRNGGSGGGGQPNGPNSYRVDGLRNGGTGVTGQGSAGGMGGTGFGGAGGGGAGGPGLPQNGAGAAGGPGLQYIISGTPTWYAGGGGGGSSPAIGLGGIGGGGAGDGRNLGTAGLVVNGVDGTGGGGGGDGGWVQPGRGGNGVVIIRYPGARKATGGTITTVDNDTVHTFTASGTFTPNTNWADMSGNNHTLSLTNSPAFNGANSGALTFDGTNNYATNTTYKPSGARSFFLWVYYNSISSLPSGYSLQGTQEVNAYNYIGIANGGQGYYYVGNGSAGGLYNAYFATNTWYHVGFTLAGDGTTKLYTNGVVVDTKTNGVGGTATQNFQIGAINNSYLLNGKVGTVTQYSRALSETEVLQNYNAQASRFN